MTAASHFWPIRDSIILVYGANMSGGSTMGPPIPTIAELSKFASSVRAKRKEVAEKLLTDRVMTREELIKLGLMSENDVH